MTRAGRGRFKKFYKTCNACAELRQRARQIYNTPYAVTKRLRLTAEIIKKRAQKMKPKVKKDLPPRILCQEIETNHFTNQTQNGTILTETKKTPEIVPAEAILCGTYLTQHAKCIHCQGQLRTRGTNPFVLAVQETNLVLACQNCALLFGGDDYTFEEFQDLRGKELEGGDGATAW